MYDGSTFLFKWRPVIPRERSHSAGTARTRASRWLAWGVGTVFIVLGIIEVAVRVLSPDPIDPEAVGYWFVSLCGGGTLVLLGSFVIPRPGWALAAVITGCLMGTIATAWTVLVPVAALALVGVCIVQTSQPDTPGDSAQHMQ